MTTETTLAELLPILTHEEYGGEVCRRAGNVATFKDGKLRWEIYVTHNGCTTLPTGEWKLPDVMVSALAFAVLGVMAERAEDDVTISHHPEHAESGDAGWTWFVSAGLPLINGTADNLPAAIFAAARRVWGIESPTTNPDA